MLSILIPVYNYDVRGLVSDLLSQINSINEAIEICLLNDGSDSQWLTSLEELASSEFVSLHHFSTNQGRVASRNKLAELAQYDYLLFIDCDAEVISETFISNYLAWINPERDLRVIAGGHVYQEEIPKEKYRLHWKYGREVEVRSLVERINNPYKSFSTFNFCIEKWVYLEYLSDIDIKGYGHEDTLMGDIMAVNVVTLEHIDNPLLHAGLKANDQFLRDASRAVKNAYLIAEDNPDIDIKLIKHSSLIKKLGLSGLFLFGLNIFENIILSNLKSSNPRLKYLQLFKLKTILNLNSEKK